MTDLSPDVPPRWRRVALALSMFLTTGVFGFLQPFVPLYLISAGLSKSQYGLVTAMGTATALLIQPILGRISDRLDARRPLMVVAAICAGGAYLAYRAADSLLAFTLLTAAGVNGYQYLNAVGGVLVGRMASVNQGGGAAYIGYRIWGSVGYILIALGTGLLVNPTLSGRATLTRADLDTAFSYGPLLFFLIAVVALLVPDPRRAAPAALPETLSDEERSASRQDQADRNRNLNHFLLAYFLYQFSLYGASAYLPLYMKAMGATPLWITAMFAAGVICEVLVMTRVGRWTDIHGRRPALIFAFLLMPLRLLLYIPATGPLWVLAVQTLHGLNFGIVGTIAIVFINDLANDRDRGALQARLAGTAGVGLALGPLTCGWLAQKWSIGGMFAIMSLIGAAGAIVLLTKVRESHPSPVPLTGKLSWLG